MEEIGIVVHERRVVQSVLQEVGEIVDLLFGKAQTVRVTRPARIREAGRQRGRCSGGGVLGNTGVEVLHHIADFGERAVVEEIPPVLELTHGQDAEPERVARVVGDFLPPVVLGVVGKAVLAQLGGVEMAPRQRVQRLDRVVADSDVEEILLDEGADAGDIRIVVLLVQHRTAVAGEAAGAAVGGRREEEPSAAPLSRRQRSVIPGQEVVERRVPGDHGAQEGRRRPEHGLVVHEDRQVPRVLAASCGKASLNNFTKAGIFSSAAD